MNNTGYVPYIPPRNFSAESARLRKELEALGIDGTKPIAVARKTVGLSEGGLIEVGVTGEAIKRASYAAEHAARYAKPVDPVMAKINKKLKNMPKRRPRPRMDSIYAAEKPQSCQISP
jgi:Na+/glutamate symporter